MANIPEKNKQILSDKFNKSTQEVNDIFLSAQENYANKEMSDDDYNLIIDNFHATLKGLNKLKHQMDRFDKEIKDAGLNTFILNDEQRSRWNEVNQYIVRERLSPLVNLIYNYEVTFINLRDIRFSQSSISTPFETKQETNIKTSMDNFPFKFYNYNDNNLVLLRMFGESNYFSVIQKSSFAPTVPSLNVVKNGNCYISIDNRRLELIYRQLCLLLSLNPELCKIDDLVFKNTNDFLKYELGIPDDVYIYIPCCVKMFDSESPRRMKTPEGVELNKFNTAMRRPEGTENPIYAGVIWQRVNNPVLEKFKDNPLNGFQMFPATVVFKGLDSKQQLQETNIKIYKNKYPCVDGSYKSSPINIKLIIDELVAKREILTPGTIGNQEEEYNNLKKLYFIIANRFIHYLKGKEGPSEIYITESDLYDNTKKFLPNFEEWKHNIEQLWEPKYGGRKKNTRRNISGGTKRKRCKKGSRRHPKTKKCVKNKTKKNKGPIFKIGVDFGGVLAKHKKGEDAEKLEEHKNTQIDMPRAIETLKKLKKNGHDLYIVSFCGKKRALEGKEEIENSGLTNVFTEQIYIKNPFKKGDVLLNFGCNFMIDDRLDLLNKIKLVDPDIVTIWFGQKKDDNNTQHICAENWDEVYKIISKTKQFHVPKVETDYKKYLSIKPQAI
jgi:hypothetical protein